MDTYGTSRVAIDSILTIWTWETLLKNKIHYFYGVNVGQMIIVLNNKCVVNSTFFVTSCTITNFYHWRGAIKHVILVEVNSYFSLYEKRRMIIGGTLLIRGNTKIEPTNQPDSLHPFFTLYIPRPLEAMPCLRSTTML